MQAFYHANCGTVLATLLRILIRSDILNREVHMLQFQDQSLRPLTTAHLAQTMSLLVLSNQELQERVQSELASNPALELLEERICPTCHRPLAQRGPCPICSANSNASKENEEPIVFLSPRESRFPSGSRNLDDTPIDQEPAAPENLSFHVLQQLAADLEPDERKIAAYMLSSLDDDGFLQDHPAIIARSNRISLSKVQHVQELISHADPPGLATMGPREALLAQLDIFDERLPSVALARRILEECFKMLAKKEFEAIARLFDVRPHQVRQAVSFIHDSLNPYPARAFWGSGRQATPADPNVYHSPDIQISRNPADPSGPLLVEIFTPVAGWLRVSPLFRKAARSKGEEAEKWNKHVEQATLFVKCLRQRNNTMRQLMEILVSRQQEFILHGPRHLVPMTRAALADQIGVHESTISRAVAHKAIQLPDGRIIPLSRFFDRSLSVRDRIKEIVDNETSPLTDARIADMLMDDGVRIARRTVAKYRSIEGILPARLRSRNASVVGV